MAYTLLETNDKDPTATGERPYPRPLRQIRLTRGVLNAVHLKLQGRRTGQISFGIVHKMSHACKVDCRLKFLSRDVADLRTLR